MVVFLGSVGLGLVWGWLLVLTSRIRVKRPFIHTTALILASIALGVVQYLYAGWPALVTLLVAMLFAIFTHIVWLRSIRPQ